MQTSGPVYTWTFSYCCYNSESIKLDFADKFEHVPAGETNAMDATTTICHRYTPPEQLAVFTKTADIIVSAAGSCTCGLI